MIFRDNNNQRLTTPRLTFDHSAPGTWQYWRQAQLQWNGGRASLHLRDRDTEEIYSV